MNSSASCYGFFRFLLWFLPQLNTVSSASKHKKAEKSSRILPLLVMDPSVTSYGFFRYFLWILPLKTSKIIDFTPFFRS